MGTSDGDDDVTLSSPRHRVMMMMMITIITIIIIIVVILAKIDLFCFITTKYFLNKMSSPAAIHERTSNYYDAVISMRSDDNIKLPSYFKFKRVDVDGRRCTCASCKNKFYLISQLFQ